MRLSPTLAPGARLARAFVLAGPPRAVFDLEGVAPKQSHALEREAPHVTGVRVGKQGRGTRVVVDLDGAPRSSAVEGGALVLTY